MKKVYLLIFVIFNLILASDQSFKVINNNTKLSVVDTESIPLVRDDVFMSTAVSPDGQYILLAADYGGLYLYDTYTKKTKDLNLRKQFWDIKWSPDGKTIAFLETNFNDTINLFLINADDVINSSGLNPKKLDSGRYSLYSISWSPDSKYIAAGIQNTSRDNLNDDTAILVYEPNQSVQPIAKGSLKPSNIIDTTYYFTYYESVDWSPDGSEIICSVYSYNIEYAQAPMFIIWKVNYLNNTIQSLTIKNSINTLNNAGASNGGTSTYSSNNNIWAGTSQEGHKIEIFSGNKFLRSIQTSASSVAFDDKGISFSPDNKFIAYFDNGKLANSYEKLLIIESLNGKEKMELVLPAQLIVYVRWISDNVLLVEYTVAHSKFKIDLINLADLRIKPLIQREYQDRHRQ